MRVCAHTHTHTYTLCHFQHLYGGDSFTFGLRHSILNRIPSNSNTSLPHTFARALRVSNIVPRVQITGVRGLSVHSSDNYLSIPPHILSHHTHIAIINIGSNDLAAGVSPLNTATLLVEKATNLITHNHVQHVFLCSVINRTGGLGPTQGQFYSAMYHFNNILKHLCAVEPHITYWCHKGFWQVPVGHWSHDGVHPNTSLGRKKFKVSIRAAIFRGAQLFS